MVFWGLRLVNLISPGRECHNSRHMSTREIAVATVAPALGVPGGELTIECRGFKPDPPYSGRVFLGETAAHIVSASQERVVIRLPESEHSLGITLKVGDTASDVHPFSLAFRLASGLHPVANPAVAPDGSIITTISGSRGERVAQPVVRVARTGEKIPLACEIMNPTGLAFDREGRLYISSRHDGTVVRWSGTDELETVAEDLGIASGIVFDSKGYLYVGDREGKIYRIDPSGTREEFALLEPSISAYHLAVDSQDRLYVTGPTFSLRDALYRISVGKAEVMIQGLARPQGIAFLPAGELLIAASYQGKKGVFRFDPSARRIAHYIAAPMLVGIAISGDDIFLADNDSIFWLRPGGGMPA